MEKDVNHLLDLGRIVQNQSFPRRKVVKKVERNRIRIFTSPSNAHSGHHSKEIELKRFIELDDLFFEGLGLWRGEGGKSKGLYFGNSGSSLIRHFLRFIEQKIGLNIKKFKVTVNVPKSSNPKKAKEKWSNELLLPIQNFTQVCVDPRIRKEYAQVYFNSNILAKLMNDLYGNSKTFTLRHPWAAARFLRGFFGAEGSVLLKKSGVLHHISFSSKDKELVCFVEKCSCVLGIKPGKYMSKGMNLQIYGYKNFKRFGELGIHTLHPEKRAKFEFGFVSYKRVNVLRGEEARGLILEQLDQGPKTYDELAAALGKARTTIQAWHVPILEKRGLIERAGRRGRAWLWTLRKTKVAQAQTFNRIPCAEPTSSSPTYPMTSR